jgi:hypothetical protein
VTPVGAKSAKGVTSAERIAWLHIAKPGDAPLTHARVYRSQASSPA